MPGVAIDVAVLLLVLSCNDYCNWILILVSFLVGMNHCSAIEPTAAAREKKAWEVSSIDNLLPSTVVAEC